VAAKPYSTKKIESAMSDVQGKSNSFYEIRMILIQVFNAAKKLNDENLRIRSIIEASDISRVALVKRALELEDNQ